MKLRNWKIFITKSYSQQASPPISLAAQKHLSFRGLILAGALLLILIWLCLPPTTLMMGDTPLYMSQALGQAQGFDFTEHFANIQNRPLLINLLALVFWLFGPTLEGAAWLAWTLAAMAILALFLFGETVTGRWSGLIAALLALGTPFLLYQLPQILTDPLAMTLTLLAFLCLVLGFDRENRYWIVVAGVLFGVGTFSRLDRVLYLLLPIVLLITTPVYRSKKSLTGTLVFYGIVAITISSLWLGLYLHNGQTPNIKFSQQLLHTITASNLTTQSASELEVETTDAPYQLIPRAVIAYAKRLPGYIITSLKPEIPLFYPILLGWIIGIWLAIQGNRPFQILLAGLLAWGPVLIVTARGEAPVRHHLYFIALSYLVIGRLTILGLEQLRRWQGPQLRQMPYYAGVLLVLSSLGYWVARPVMEPEDRFIPISNANQPEIIAAAAWLTENLQPEEAVAISRMWAEGLYFFTNRDFKAYSVPFTSIPLESTLNPGHILFTFKHIRKPFSYITLPEADFLALLRRPNIKYLVITGDNPWFSPLNTIQNVAHLNGVKPVFHTGTGNRQIYIFEVEPEQVYFRQPPATFSYPATMAHLLFGSEDISQFSIPHCVQDASQLAWVLDILNTEIILEGTPRETALAYQCLGTIAALNGNIEQAEMVYKRGSPSIAAIEGQNIYDYHILNGTRLLAIGDVEGATSEYKQAVDIKPTIPSLVALAYGRQRQEQYDQSVLAYHQALNLADGQDTARINLRLGEALLKMNQPLLAVEVFRKSLSDDPTSVNAAARLLASSGKSFFDQGQFERGLDAYYFSIKLMQASQSEPREINLLQDTLTPLPQRMVQDIIADLNNESPIPNWITDLLAQRVRKSPFDAAQNHLTSVNDNNSVQPITQTVFTSYKSEKLTAILDTYLVWGFDYIDQKYVLAAIEAYESTMKQHPDKDGLVKLAEVYLKLGRTQQAINAYERALAIRPEEIWPAYDLADTYLKYGKQLEVQQDFETAFRAYHRAFELTPNVSEVLDAMVSAYRTFGRDYFDSALISSVIRAYRQQTIDLNPDNLQNYFIMAGVYQQFGHPDEAIRLYRQAAEHWPDDSAVYQRLAALYQRQGNRPAAVATLQQAIESNPNQSELYTQLAGFYENKQKQDLYDQATDNNPHSAWPHLELGQLYLQQAMSNAPN